MAVTMPAPQADSRVFSRVLGRALPVVARAEGVALWDTDGRRYLGVVSAGPFAEPDSLRADSPVPRFWASWCLLF